MKNYKQYVEYDDELNNIFGKHFDAIEKLSKQQIEKVVFYLKSIHSYYADSWGSWQLKDVYDEKLLKIKFNEKQIELQNTALRIMRKIALLNIFGALVLASGVIAIALKAWLVAVVLLCGFAYCYYYANKKLLVKAIETYKEQDRRYFLESIRTAKGCNELDWSGLFAYYDGQHDGPQSDKDLENTDRQVRQITQNLKDALYNDEDSRYDNLAENA
jgi:hypothetical protein